MLFEEEERRNCNLIIRIRERVKKRFQALYYLPRRRDISRSRTSS